MKLLKEIYRILKQIFYLPRYLTNLLFGTFYYDNFLAKSKIKNSGNLPLNKKVVIFLIFPDRGLAKSHLRTLKYFIRNNFSNVNIIGKNFSQKIINSEELQHQK